jgi:hypothetical protein
MKHYYIIKNRITDFNYELNPAEFNYQKLTSEQVDFYLANQNASINEVLNMTLNTPYTPTLDDLKNNKINSLDNDFEMLLEQGYFDEAENITLAIKEQDRTAFSQLLTMLKLAAELSQELPSQMAIADKDGGLHLLTILNLKALLLRYGFYYHTISSNLVGKKNSVKNATTESEINEITL